MAISRIFHTNKVNKLYDWATTSKMSWVASRRCQRLAWTRRYKVRGWSWTKNRYKERKVSPKLSNQPFMVELSLKFKHLREVKQKLISKVMTVLVGPKSLQWCTCFHNQLLSLRDASSCFSRRQLMTEYWIQFWSPKVLLSMGMLCSRTSRVVLLRVTNR